MAVGKNFLKVNAENVMQLALLLSITRPDLQTYLPNLTQPLQEIPGGYNWTGPYLTHGSTSPFNYENVNQKPSADAMEQNTNFVNDLLNLQYYRGRYEEVINMQGGIASQDAFETESGYSSDHGSLSPLPTSASPRRDEVQTNSLGSHFDVSQLGASGFTPDNTEDTNLYKLLLDTFQDGFHAADYQEHVPYMPIKAEPLSPFSQQEYGTSCPVTKGAVLDKAGCLEDESFYHDPNQKNTLEQIGLQTNLPEEIFDPFSINWSSGSAASNATGASFNTDVPDLSLANDFQFDLDTWAEDFNLPLDIIKTEEQNQPALPSDSSLPLSDSIILSNVESSKAKEVTPPSSVAGKSEDLSATTAALVRRKIATPTKSLSAIKNLNKEAKSKTLVGRPLKFEYSDSRIINMPVDEFNALLEAMSEPEAKYARDLRRRGKNKEAARTCRKRKLEVIDSLEDEVLQLQAKKQEILAEREKLKGENVALKDKLLGLQTSVLNTLRDDQGQPLSPNDFSLFQGEDGNIFVAKSLNR